MKTYGILLVNFYLFFVQIQTEQRELNYESGNINVTCKVSFDCLRQTNHSICHQEKCFCLKPYFERRRHCALDKHLGDECETSYDCSVINSECMKNGEKWKCVCGDEFYWAYGECLDFEQFQDRKCLDALIYLCILTGILIVIGMALFIYGRIIKQKLQQKKRELQEIILTNNASTPSEENNVNSEQEPQGNTSNWHSVDLNVPSSGGGIAFISTNDKAPLVDATDSSMC